jgi:hypothetical protein
MTDDLGRKLDAVGCAIKPLYDWDAEEFAFPPAETEKLAVMEHERWMAQKAGQGYRHGPVKDEIKKTHPCLVPWADLPDSEKEKDRAAVRLIPRLLADAGFAVYRLK